jgi:peptidoglycan-associated lipoprotein
MNMNPTGSDSGTIEGLQTVHFDYDKATVPAAEKAKLQGNVAWMKKNASAKMLVEGHCDQRGSTEYNLSLGERRANAVKQMLVSQGISASRITTVSFGKEKLIAEGDSEADMAKNRRANFVPTATK